MITPRVAIQAEPFDAGAAIAALSAEGVGGVASFVGVVRGGDGIVALELEHYPGMTEAALLAIAEDACGRWSLAGLTIVHRVGRLMVGEPIVLVVAAAAHRASAIEAMHYAIDRLKTDAPFWKREHRADGSAAWVEARAGDDAAVARWAERA